MAKTETMDNEKTQETESEYTAEEFALSANAVFGQETPPDCIVAAFRLEGINKATKALATKIVNEFMKKEVK